MSRKFLFNDESDDEFETEALQFLNDKKEEKKDKEEDSDDNLLGSEDSEEDEDEGKEESDPTDSDDEAPESIGFSESRYSIMAQLKSAMKQVDQEKQKQKEKRKLKEVRFKEQKEKKMKYMHETRLPDEVLENIDEVIPKNVKHRKKLEKEAGKQKEAPTRNIVSEKPRKKKKQNRDKSRAQPTEMSEDYIPLVDDVSGIEVAEVRHFEKQQKSLAQKAADFRNSRLYGKGVPRETNQSRLLKCEKKKHRLR